MADQNFCRACGLGLEKIATSVFEQLPTKVDTSLQERKAQLEKFGVIALCVFGFGVLGFLAYAIALRLSTTQGSLLATLAVIGFVIMMACGITSVILFARAKELGEAAGKRKPDLVKEGESTKELLTEGHFEPVPTITERTTELLVEKRDTSGTNRS